MVHKKQIYLDATLFNCYFDEGRDLLHKATVGLFEEINKGKYTAYTSQ